MSAPKVDIETPMDVILRLIIFTLSRLMGSSFTAFLAPPFEALLAQWGTVQSGDVQLQKNLGQAQANVVEADDALDDFVDEVLAAVLLATDNNRESALYLSLFGGEIPSRFARPVLSAQLQQMKLWPQTLLASGIPAVVALAGKLPALLAAGDVAAAALAAAEKALDLHHTLGAKKDLVDQLNVERSKAFGELDAMPHANPGANLPADFARRFFWYDASDPPKSVEQLVKSLSAAQKKVARLEKQLEEAKARAADKATTAKQKKAAAIQKQLDEKQKNAGQTSADIDKLKAELAALEEP